MMDSLHDPPRKPAAHATRFHRCAVVTTSCLLCMPATMTNALIHPFPFQQSRSFMVLPSNRDTTLSQKIASSRTKSTRQVMILQGQTINDIDDRNDNNDTQTASSHNGNQTSSGNYFSKKQDSDNPFGAFGSMFQQMAGNMMQSAPPKRKGKFGLPKPETYVHINEFDADLAKEIEDALAGLDLGEDILTTVTPSTNVDSRAEESSRAKQDLNRNYELELNQDHAKESQMKSPNVEYKNEVNHSECYSRDATDSAIHNLPTKFPSESSLSQSRDLYFAAEEIENSDQPNASSMDDNIGGINDSGLLKHDDNDESSESNTAKESNSAANSVFSKKVNGPNVNNNVDMGNIKGQYSWKTDDKSSTRYRAIIGSFRDIYFSTRDSYLFEKDVEPNAISIAGRGGINNSHSLMADIEVNAISNVSGDRTEGSDLIRDSILPNVSSRFIGDSSEDGESLKNKDVSSRAIECSERDDGLLENHDNPSASSKFEDIYLFEDNENQSSAGRAMGSDLRDSYLCEDDDVLSRSIRASNEPDLNSIICKGNIEDDDLLKDDVEASAGSNVSGDRTTHSDFLRDGKRPSGSSRFIGNSARESNTSSRAIGGSERDDGLLENYDNPSESNTFADSYLLEDNENPISTDRAMGSDLRDIYLLGYDVELRGSDSTSGDGTGDDFLKNDAELSATNRASGRIIQDDYFASEGVGIGHWPENGGNKDHTGEGEEYSSTFTESPDAHYDNMKGMEDSDLFIMDEARELAQSLDLDIHDIIRHKRRSDEEITASLAASRDGYGANNQLDEDKERPEPGVVDENDVRTYYDRINDLLQYTLSATENDEHMPPTRDLRDPMSGETFDQHNFNDSAYRENNEYDPTLEQSYNQLYTAENDRRKTQKHGKTIQGIYQTPQVTEDSGRHNPRTKSPSPPLKNESIKSKFRDSTGTSDRGSSALGDERMTDQSVQKEWQWTHPRPTPPPPKPRQLQKQQDANFNKFRRPKTTQAFYKETRSTDFQRGVFGAVRPDPKSNGSLRGHQPPSTSTVFSSTSPLLSYATSKPRIDRMDYSSINIAPSALSQLTSIPRKDRVKQMSRRSPSTPYTPLPFQQMSQDKFRQPYQDQEHQPNSEGPVAYNQQASLSHTHRSHHPLNSDEPHSIDTHASSFQPFFQQRPNFASIPITNAVSSIPNNDNAYCTEDALFLAMENRINLKNVSPTNPDYPITAHDVIRYIESFDSMQHGLPTDHQSQSYSIMPNQSNNLTNKVPQTSNTDLSNTDEDVFPSFFSQKHPMHQHKMQNTDGEASPSIISKEQKLHGFESKEKKIKDETIGQSKGQLTESSQHSLISTEKEAQGTVSQDPQFYGIWND